MPPVSKTTPLPTSASGASSPPPFQRITTTRDGLAEPWPTASSSRMPSFSIAASSRISISSPSSSIASSCAAKSSVPSTFAGAEVRSRAKNTPSQTAAWSFAAAATASGFETITVTGPCGSAAFDFMSP